MSFEWQRDACAIAGIGNTEFSRNSGRSELTMAIEATLAALKDAGMTVADIDGIVRCQDDVVHHNDLVEALGIPNLRYWGANGPGGAAPSAQIGHAVAAIASGQADVVLCFRSLNANSGLYKFGTAPATPDPETGGDGGYGEYFAPYGLHTPGQVYALMTRKHMIDYGTTSEQLAEIALVCRKRAQANPNAQMGSRELTLDDYMNSRWISEPLRLFDFCLTTDGACAVIVTSTDRARDCPKPPVLIRAVAQGTGPDPQGGVMHPMLMRPSITDLPSRYVANEVYKRAGLGPTDVDVAQMYDCFTPAVLLQIEDYGFCQKGEGGPFVASGAIDLGGALPINTGGGHLSEGYIHGMNHVVEGVRQIRGESTSQVKDANVCLVASSPPVTTSGLILVKD